MVLSVILVDSVSLVIVVFASSVLLVGSDILDCSVMVDSADASVDSVDASVDASVNSAE